MFCFLKLANQMNLFLSDIAFKALQISMASEYVSVWPINRIFGKDFSHAGRELQHCWSFSCWNRGRALLLQLPNIIEYCIWIIIRRGYRANNSHAIICVRSKSTSKSVRQTTWNYPFPPRRNWPHWRGSGTRNAVWVSRPPFFFSTKKAYSVIGRHRDSNKK